MPDPDGPMSLRRSHPALCLRLPTFGLHAARDLPLDRFPQEIAASLSPSLGTESIRFNVPDSVSRVISP